MEARTGRRRKRIFHAGDKVYIVESNRKVTEARVLREECGFYLVGLRGGGIMLRGNRLFDREEEAAAAIPEEYRNNEEKDGKPVGYQQPAEETARRSCVKEGNSSPYSYGNYRSPYGI